MCGGACVHGVYLHTLTGSSSSLLLSSGSGLFCIVALSCTGYFAQVGEFDFRSYVLGLGYGFANSGKPLHAHYMA
jgi:hypothetical protein